MAQSGGSNSRDNAVVAMRSVLQPSCEPHQRSTLFTLTNRAPRHGCNRLVNEVRIDDAVARQMKRQRLQLSNVYV